jgi:hypothetical protein
MGVGTRCIATVCRAELLGVVGRGDGRDVVAVARSVEWQ